MDGCVCGRGVCLKEVGLGQDLRMGLGFVWYGKRREAEGTY